MRYKKLNYFLAAVFICFTLSPNLNAAEEAVESSLCSCRLRIDFRRLWEDHITWTRVFIISAFGKLPDQDASVERLLQNQVDIGNAIRPFYGDVGGDKLTSLLKEHVSIATSFVKAIKEQDGGRAATESKRWYSNADEIAAFLSASNPKNWPLEHITKKIRDHLDLTIKEVLARSKQDWKADVATYDEIHNEILELADTLAYGILSQFPEHP